MVDPIAPPALDILSARYDVTVRLRPAPHELPGLLHGQDAIVLRSGITLPGPVLAAAGRLRVVARAGNGTDNIDLPAAAAAGIQVFNVPSVSSRAVAELALALTFAVARNVVTADRQVRAGVWNKAALAGAELTGKMMGVIGVGDIGGHVAALATGIGMNVIGSVGNPTPQRREAWQARGVRLTSTRNVLAAADVVVVACPLTGRTRHLIDADGLAVMKPDACLINVGRAQVVDDQALYAVLRERRIGGAALDVHAAESGTPALAALDNVVLTPHIGAMTADAQERIGGALIQGLELALAGRDAPTRIC
ncbi:NAD(P)-dependent oxidoreductase [Streptomyces sp. NPDC093109]|uniref:NAD(P)-dependent oxidoreductase n=1 Tax=Streptomyces sp. NPDC093109 TaxID=3154977 RepID=UPI00344B644D